MTGDAHTDSIDNWTMATCACGGLGLVASAGGEAPKLISLRARLSALDTSGNCESCRLMSRLLRRSLEPTAAAPLQKSHYKIDADPVPKQNSAEARRNQ